MEVQHVVLRIPSRPGTSNLGTVAFVTIGAIAIAAFAAVRDARTPTIATLREL